MTTRQLAFTSLTLLATTALAACDDEPAAGTISAVVYGEAYIEDEIPPDTFSDGWTVTFTRFMVSLGTFKAKAGEAGMEVGTTDFKIYDLAASSDGAGYEIGTFDAPGGLYDHFGYQIRPEPSATAVNATEADVTDFKAAGYSVWVAGTATRGAEARSFEWGFTPKLTYSHCEGEEPTSLDGGTLAVQATIHGDHLFLDDLTSPEPNVSFDLIAAADGKDGTPADGDISLAELTATDIRTESRYQVGSLKGVGDVEIVNLHRFIEFQVTTLGHFNGEGHCAGIAATP